MWPRKQQVSLQGRKGTRRKTTSGILQESNGNSPELGRDPLDLGSKVKRTSQGNLQCRTRLPWLWPRPGK